jgi:ATP-binding cassette subfamily A (ABC1) protein 3
VTWHARVFTHTHVLLILLIHLLLGLYLASWSFFIAAPFGKSPALAAIATTILAVVFGILSQVYAALAGSVAGTFFLSLLLPPGFYIFAIRAVCGFEVRDLGANVVKADPTDGLRLLPLLVAAMVRERN